MSDRPPSSFSKQLLLWIVSIKGIMPHLIKCQLLPCFLISLIEYFAERLKHPSPSKGLSLVCFHFQSRSLIEHLLSKNGSMLFLKVPAHDLSINLIFLSERYPRHVSMPSILSLLRYFYRSHK
jgi:hypothetical protein